jgi:threonylcarbamoyladenosine tRNA methylthiotransferase MtaB
LPHHQQDQHHPNRIRIAFRTTGCKVNQADTEAVRQALADLPISWVAANAPADMVVVNACTVTRAADRDGRAAVNRASRSGASVFLAGCLATRLAESPDESRIPDDCTIIPGTGDRAALIGALRREITARTGSFDLHPDDVDLHREDTEARLAPMERARPLIKVQDGCDCRCAYCIVPLVRGPSTSEPLARVMASVESAAIEGAAEVVLTGVDMAAWGRDSCEGELHDLLERLIAMGTGLRFRLSSLEPHGLTDRLLDIMAASRDICTHLHVPVQSGSDRVLAAMRRPRETGPVIDSLEKAAKRIPGLVLGLDILCGFPGETDEDFQRTLHLVESLPVTYLHVFPFSPRPGTHAATLVDDVSHAEKARRTAAMRTLSQSRRAAHAASLVGREIEVVDVIQRKEGVIESLATDYTRVRRLDARGPRTGRFTVIVERADGPDAVSMEAG